MNEKVDYYIWNILKRQLQKNKVSNINLYKILDQVKLQLYSILCHWNDYTFRNAILLIGSEEGTFYETHNVIIANMVVVTIRNSLLEGVCSDNYKAYGCARMLSNHVVKEITSRAIVYFSEINLEEISKTIEVEDDFYKTISDKYPVAMKSLMELAKCSEMDREHDYENYFENVYDLEELKLLDDDSTIPSVDSLSNHITKVIEDGISPLFNDSLCQLLKGILDKESHIFVIDSFKMLTRNFEKLMKVLEFVLTHNAIFLTSNYLLSNNYVSRRKDLLRASHNFEEFYDKIKYLPDISGKYNAVLKEKFALSVEE